MFKVLSAGVLGLHGCEFNGRVDRDRPYHTWPLALFYTWRYWGSETGQV